MLLYESIESFNKLNPFLKLMLLEESVKQNSALKTLII